MESTLSLAKTEIDGEIGFFLGFGRGADNGDTDWSDSQAAAIDSAVKSGLRQFYFPPPIDQSGQSYEWSFLKPTASITLQSGLRAMQLPDDFGGMDGNITITGDSGLYPDCVEIRHPGALDQMYAAMTTETGWPQYAALRPVKGTTGTRGQRTELYVFPEADAAYTLRFAYYILADALTGDRPYAYGGMQHAETILAACKMAAEEAQDDTQGVWAAKFRERLMASVSIDRRMKAQKLGYNGDRSDGVVYDPRSRLMDGAVTFDGVQY